MEEHIESILTKFEQAPFSDTQRTAKEITQHFVKFMEWMTVYSFGVYSPQKTGGVFQYKWFIDIPDNIKEYDAEELYTYWKTNFADSKE